VFSGFKYRVAKNLVLLEMERDGLLDAETRKRMSEIMFSAANRQFGRQAISTKVAKDKYSAAALVFSRLAAFEMYKPSTSGVSHLLWAQAARRAMLHSGTSEEESLEIVEFLVQQQVHDNNLANPPW